jgi:hypothetical protein
MTSSMIVVLQSVAATGALVIALVFLRFWRRTLDTLFAFFAGAFCLLALSWFLLAVFSPTEEARPYIYGLRLVAFTLIITAVVQKNRSSE